PAPRPDPLTRWGDRAAAREVATAGPRAGRRSRSESSVMAALSGGTVSVVLAILAMSRAAQHGVNAFFGAPDARFFRLVARDPFGHGHAIHSAVVGGEASYRYGRILLPLLAWVTAAGRPGAVNVTLVLWNIAAIGACVTAAALLLSTRGANPRLALAILVTPGLLVLST